MIDFKTTLMELDEASLLCCLNLPQEQGLTFALLNNRTPGEMRKSWTPWTHEKPTLTQHDLWPLLSGFEPTLLRALAAFKRLVCHCPVPRDFNLVQRYGTKPRDHDAERGSRIEC